MKAKSIAFVLDRLCDMVPSGHLLAAMDPAALLQTACDELHALRLTVSAWAAWRSDLDLDVHATEQALYDAAEMWIGGCGPEPGELICEVGCPCCGAGLTITYGDDVGEYGVLATGPGGK
jgi:hypothetical protein